MGGVLGQVWMMIIVELLKATHTFDSIYNSQSVLHLRMAPDNPATQLQNDLFCEHRLAKGILTSWALNSTTLYCDALTDNDRGYFPRVGILDRLYNPKPAWQLIKYLHGILNELPLPSGDVSVQSFANGLQLHSDTVEIELIFDTQEEQCNTFRSAMASLQTLINGLNSGKKSSAWHPL